MKEFDFSEFSKFMSQIFELYEKPVKNLRIWFDDLIEFELSQIKFAFEVYRKKPKGEYFPKTAAPIISIIQEMKSFQEKKLESFRTKPCDYPGCKNEGFEPFGIGKEQKVIWVCRNHGDEIILKHFPDSPQAICIRGARQHTDYAKQAGMANREWAEEMGAVKKFEELRKGLGATAPNGHPKTIFEFESDRLNGNAYKNGSCNTNLADETYEGTLW